jgi:LysR family hydrogen peroxide-inducible transcriptional activator
MITLRQLRYLAALARHRHFGRAAKDCAISQPALSMQVRELEREIGAELVERRPNDVALTDTGLEVVNRAEQILAAIRDLVDFARHRDVLSGSLKLGIIPTLLTYCRAYCPDCRRNIRGCGWSCARHKPNSCLRSSYAASSTA